MYWRETWLRSASSCIFELIRRNGKSLGGLNWKFYVKASPDSEVAILAFFLVFLLVSEVVDELVEALDVPGVHSFLVAGVFVEPGVVGSGEERVEPAGRVESLNLRLVVDEQVSADDGLVFCQHQLRDGFLAEVLLNPLVLFCHAEFVVRNWRRTDHNWSFY